MKNLLMLVHLLATLATLLGLGGAKTIVADSLLMKERLLIINRFHRRAPNLTVIDRLLLGLLFYHLMEQAVDCMPVTRQMIIGGRQ